MESRTTIPEVTPIIGVDTASEWVDGYRESRIDITFKDPAGLNDAYECKFYALIYEIDTAGWATDLLSSCARIVCLLIWRRRFLQPRNGRIDFYRLNYLMVKRTHKGSTTITNCRFLNRIRSHKTPLTLKIL